MRLSTLQESAVTSKISAEIFLVMMLNCLKGERKKDCSPPTAEQPIIFCPSVLSRHGNKSPAVYGMRQSVFPLQTANCNKHRGMASRSGRSTDRNILFSFLMKEETLIFLLKPLPSLAPRTPRGCDTTAPRRPSSGPRVTRFLLRLSHRSCQTKRQSWKSSAPFGLFVHYTAGGTETWQQRSQYKVSPESPSSEGQETRGKVEGKKEESK
ncbi:uncharacterized protein LOC144005928 [Festucalex cinctus]